MKKRCGFFYFNEKSGEAFDYVLYLLEKTEILFERLIIISANEMKEQTLEKFSEFSSDIYRVDGCRGLVDVLRFGVLEKNVLKFEMEKYSELVYYDDSFFGPFCEMSEIYDKMETNTCDFWGITKRFSYCDNFGKEYNTYLEPYFVVIKDKMLHSGELIRFLETRKNEIDISEDYFTDYFAKRGYKWESYVNDEQVMSVNQQYSFDLLLYASYDMIKKYQCPILKKEVFEIEKLPSLEFNLGDQISCAFEFIKEHTEYDVDLIWQYILKKCNISLIRQNLNLSYVLKDNQVESLVNEKRNCAIFAHIYYKDLLDECFEYLAQIPKDMDLWITVCDEEARQYITSKLNEISRENFTILIAGNRGRDLAALLITFQPYVQNYDYICFLHDKKTTGGKGYVTVGNSFMHLVWDNLLGNETYINNIVNFMNENKRLGILAPPIPYHSGYIRLLGDAWTICYGETKRLSNLLGLEVDIATEFAPFVLSTSFWCKTDALKILFNYKFKLDDFPEEPMELDGTFSHALERVLIYVAQNAGYYSATVQNIKSASNNLTNMEYLLSKSVSDSLESFGNMVIQDMFSGKNYANRIRLIKFVMSHSKICIYGQGNNGKNVATFIEKQGLNFDCFVVSDGYSIKRESYGYQAYYLSEMQKELDNFGVVIAVDKQYRQEVVSNLALYKCTDYFIVS